MATTRSRIKQEGEKTSNTKRTSKSIDPRSFTPPKEINYQPPSVYYQCKGCRNIISNSNCVQNELELEELILLFPTTTENFSVNNEEVFLGQEAEYDQFCAFKVVTCGFCGETLGKFYLSTTEKIMEAKNTYVVPESNFLLFDTRTAKVSTPSAKKVKKEKSFTTSKKVVVTSVVKEKDLLENKENIETYNKENKEDKYYTDKKDKRNNKSTKETKENVQFTPTNPKTIKYQESTEKKSEVSSFNSSPISKREDEEEEKKIIEEKRDLFGPEKLPPIKEGEGGFLEIRGLLRHFAQILDQFDKRLATSEKSVIEINKTLTSVYGSLNVAELIDLSDSS